MHSVDDDTTVKRDSAVQRVRHSRYRLAGHHFGEQGILIKRLTLFNTALFQIISAASTYVVILIQFGSIKRHIVSGEAGGGAPPSQTILFPA